MVLTGIPVKFLSTLFVLLNVNTVFALGSIFLEQYWSWKKALASEKLSAKVWQFVHKKKNRLQGVMKLIYLVNKRKPQKIHRIWQNPPKPMMKTNAGLFITLSSLNKIFQIKHTSQMRTFNFSVQFNILSQLKEVELKWKCCFEKNRVTIRKTKGTLNCTADLLWCSWVLQQAQQLLVYITNYTCYRVTPNTVGMKLES